MLTGECKRGQMRLILAICCVIAWSASAPAQTGVTNPRDANGNLIRNTGMNPVRGSSPAIVSNPGGTVRSTLGPTPPTNARLNNGTGR
jgi:hypothetical protein